jgi:hypothetical protein
VIGHTKTGDHRGRCHARVRRSVSVRIFPISVFGQLPKETHLFSTETGSKMAFLSAQVRGDRTKTLTKGTRPGFSTVRPRAIASSKRRSRPGIRSRASAERQNVCKEAGKGWTLFHAVLKTCSADWSWPKCVPSHALEVASPFRQRACDKFAIKDCLDAMFIVGVRVPIDSLGWGGGRGIAV